MLSYEETLDRLYALHRTPSRERSLSHARVLDRALGHPSKAYPVIHIAGSNGKGSVATKIAKALELAGYRVGLYTSPHLFCFRERIVIQSEPISKEGVVKGMAALFSLGGDPTFFELTTAFAFEMFRAERVDVAVVEVGMGGRLDATNIVDPLLTVITSVSCEHTEVLGEEVELIAAEKGGILKRRSLLYWDRRRGGRRFATEPILCIARSCFQKKLALFSMKKIAILRRPHWIGCHRNSQLFLRKPLKRE